MIDLANKIESIKLMFPEHCEDIDLVYSNDLENMLFVIDELNELCKNVREPQTILTYSRDYGILANLTFKHATFPIKKIRTFDSDPTITTISDEMNKTEVIDGWKFKASTVNIMELKYDPYTLYDTLRHDGSSVELTDNPSIIINLSCEKMDNLDQWIKGLPRKKLLVLQSSVSLAELREQIRLNILSEKNKNTKSILMGYKP